MTMSKAFQFKHEDGNSDPEKAIKVCCHSSTGGVEAGGLRASWLTDPVELQASGLQETLLHQVGKWKIHDTLLLVLHTYIHTVNRLTHVLKHTNTACM